MVFFRKSKKELHFEVIPSTLQEKGTLLTGELGVYQDKPVVFTYDSRMQNIMIPESLEPIYPAIEEAVVSYLRKIGKM